MRAIILAAGCGKRMGHLTANYPKAMLPLHGKPLIEWQMEAIQQAGISEIAIIKGYKADIFSYEVTYFTNPRWSQTNMLSTLLCADDWLSEETCLVAYSDIVYQAEAIEQLKNASGDIAITYDPSWLSLWQQRFDDPLSDAEIFQYKDNLLLDVGGKTTELNAIQGQYMGLLKFTPTGWRQVKLLLQQLSSDVVDKMDMTALLKLMLRKNQPIHVVAIHSSWCEIDNVRDYELCQKLMNNLVVVAEFC